MNAKQVIPYRTYTFQTPLSESEIQAVVRKHAHLGQWDGLLIKSKPYYGQLSAGYFEIRETGAHKRHSHKPALSVFIQPQGAFQRVVLTVKPHGLVLSLAILFVGSCLFFLLLNLWHFLRTWDPAPVVNYIFIVAIVGGIFVLPFHFAAERILHFWKRELRLQP
jgi:hypothetical protein